MPPRAAHFRLQYSPHEAASRELQVTFAVLRPALFAVSLASLSVACGGGDKRSDANLRGVRLAAVIKGLDNPYFVTMRDGLVATARRDAARLRVAAAAPGLQDTAGQASALESLTADHPACYVVNPINQTNLVPALSGIPGDTPIVNVDSFIAKQAAKAVGVEITTYIGTDNRAGGRLGADAMAALVDHGAKVAVVTGIPGDVGSGLRAEGFEQGDRGRFEIVTSIAADFERDKAKLAAAELLRENPRIVGFFAVNDVMALGAMAALRDRGIAVPSAMAVAGFDDIVTLRDATPGVTTVRLPLEDLGAWALDLVLGPAADQPRIRRVRGEVILRESTPERIPVS
jgi:ribose transport system substrate-binding protein